MHILYEHVSIIRQRYNPKECPECMALFEQAADTSNPNDVARKAWRNK